MKFFTVLFVSVIIMTAASAQPLKKGVFSVSSPAAQDAKDYGTVTVSAGATAVVIGTVMAYGENVKGLTIRINNGFAFKLAPSQTGTMLNYVAPSLNIVLQPGEKAKIEFISDSKTGAKQLHVSGEVLGE